MKKALRILSPISCIGCGIGLAVLIFPALAGYDLPTQWMLSAPIVAISCVTMMLWLIYAFLKEKDNVKLKIVVIASILLEVLVLSDVLYEITFFRNISFYAIIIVPIISNLLLMVYSKK